MPDITQYNFNLREIAQAMLREAKITDGKWSFGVNLGVNIGNMGPTEREALPSAMIQIQSFNLVKAPPEAEESELVIDASKL